MLVVFWLEGTINFWAYLKIITHIELRFTITEHVQELPSALF